MFARAPSARGLSHFERAIERARMQLTQAVSVALSDGLEALGDRLQGTRRSSSSLLGQVGAAAEVHGHRLREVIERDRALIASSPLAEEAAPAPAAVTTAPELDVSLELDVPFVASAAAVAPPAVQICDEPIRTRTMAKLLGGQGPRARALSIYDHLLAKSPLDEALRAEAESLRASE